MDGNQHVPVRLLIAGLRPGRIDGGFAMKARVERRSVESTTVVSFRILESTPGRARMRFARILSPMRTMQSAPMHG